MPVIPWTGQLSPEQLAAVDTLLRFSKPIQTLAGYAGVGKTTVIKALQQQLRNFAVCAYTGKAANVLRKKGVSATTIHQRVYRPRKEEEHGEVTFERKSYNEICCDGFIIDEASMVDDEIYQDLTSYALPIIFVGDHGQLEPVSGGTLNLMAKPDITLEEIHRNAGEIAQFAEFIRKELREKIVQSFENRRNEIYELFMRFDMPPFYVEGEFDADSLTEYFHQFVAA